MSTSWYSSIKNVIAGVMVVLFSSTIFATIMMMMMMMSTVGKISVVRSASEAFKTV